MNIRQIEEQLGIPRANVRYYEKEGLLHPQRGENNYRNYSEEDVETLKKIKLLRQLDIPVDTIRSVQAGEMSLEEALSFQSKLLRSEAARLESSQTICHSMLTDRVTYATLEPAKYENLKALSTPAKSDPPEPPKPPVEGAVWAHAPWQRFWARSFDFAIVDALCALFFSLVFHISEQNTPELLMTLLTLPLSWILLALLEPLLLSTWGTTPGKWLLGLELRTKKGTKLSFLDALWRVGGVFSHGYGLNIPIYNLMRHYRCYQDCKCGWEMPYDEEEGYLYYSLPGDRWFWRAVVSLLATALLLAPVELFSKYQVIVPPNRGDITPAEFIENVDYVGQNRYLQLWRSRDDWEVTDTAPLPDGGIAYHYIDTYENRSVCTLETDSQGFVTAVVVTAEGTDLSHAALPLGSLNNFAIALQGTEFTGLGIVHSRITTGLDPDRFDERIWKSRNDDTLTYYEGPFTFTAELECSNFSFIQYGQLYGSDGLSKGDFRFTARLEKAP